MALELRLLGPLQALRDGEEVPLPGVKLRAVLATLALRAGEAVSVDRLADVLWADAPPQTLMTQIQAQISTLRRLLDPLHAPGTAGELIETRPPGYRLNADAVGIDLDRFEAALRDGREARETGATSVAVEHFRRGLKEWRGAALDDLPRDAFGPEAARLEDLRLAALELRIEAELALDRHEPALEELAALCSAHPYRETLWEKRMIALYRSGRQAEALAAYRTARSTFAEALGIEPGERLRDLERAILRHDPALDGHAVAGALATSRPVLVAGVLDDLAWLTGLALAMADADVIAVGHVAVDADLAQAACAVRAEIAAVGAGAPVRCAAFRSRDVAHDLARLAQEQDAGLVVVSLARGAGLPLELLAECAADVALVRAGAVDALETIAVPFTGSTHDWAAVALAGRMAASRGLPLELIGVDAGAAGDASRALANAALALARVAGVEAAPRLVPAGALAEAPPEAALVVTGLPESYRRTGLGSGARAALLDREGCGVVFAHCGPRPGALAPASSLTRFTWSLAD